MDELGKKCVHSQCHCHIITGLEVGGAERMLARLLTKDPSKHHVIALKGGGGIERELEALGVSFENAGLLFSPHFPFRLLAFLRRVYVLQPVLLVGWMYHGNLAASLAGYITQTPVVWNIRHSLHDLGKEKFSLRFVIRVCALLSRTACLIIYNSVVAAQQHENVGYASKHRALVSNGIDTSKYRPDVTVRNCVREELRLSSDDFLIGHFARFHPMKGHKIFLQAIANIVSSHHKCKVLMVGNDVDSSNKELFDEVLSYGLQDYVHLLGERSDVSRLMVGLDVLVSSSSWGEGFPNVVMEAMSCGVVVIATDIGDSKVVVGDAGYVVSPNSPECIAEHLKRLIDSDHKMRQETSGFARKRILDKYDIKNIRAEYINLWDDCSM